MSRLLIIILDANPTVLVEVSPEEPLLIAPRCDAGERGAK
jgi:hypothetical protein